MAASTDVVDYREFAKRAIVAGFVTLILASLLVGIETVSTVNGLRVATRYRAVFYAAIGVAIVYFMVEMLKVGRTLVPLIVGLVMMALFAVLEWANLEGLPLGDQLPFESSVVNWGVMLVPLSLVLRSIYLMIKPEVKTSRTRSDSREQGFTRVYLKYNKFFGFALIVIAVGFPFMPFADRRLVDVGTLVVTYIMVGWGLNIVVGLAGLLDLGYVAFYAVGAYSYAMFAVNFDLSFWVALPIAGALAATFGIILGFPVLRLRGDYLAIVTLGFGEMIRIILTNWWWFTGGPNGINNIPRPSFFGLVFERNPPPGTESFAQFFSIAFSPSQRVSFLYYLILVFALATNLFTLRIRRLPISRAW